MKHTLLIPFFIILGTIYSKAQFQINGDASQSNDSCYIITNAISDQSGSIWTLEKIDLTEPFDFRFKMHFGTIDGTGADGFVFALQPIGTSVGGTGQGLGINGITPSFGVEFDTYQNTNPNSDPASDHMAIFRDGNVNHNTANNLAGPVDISPTSPDVEDGQFYWVRFTWDPDSTLFEVYYDCDPRLSYRGDIINDIFSGDPEVFWGVTGATGLFHNKQEICLINLETTEFALESQSLCDEEDSIQLNVPFSDVFTYNWSPNTNITSTTTSDPQVFPESTTTYFVDIQDECLNSTKDTVTIFVPHEIDPINDTSICHRTEVTFTATSWSDAVYTWNDVDLGNQITVSDSGDYILKVVEYECTYMDTIHLANETCHVPNIFTPNGDSFNDFFDLGEITKGEENWDLNVYNRYGRLVYSRLSYDNTWDGGDLHDGTYYYEISKSGVIPLKGWVQILR